MECWRPFLVSPDFSPVTTVRIRARQDWLQRKRREDFCFPAERSWSWRLTVELWSCGAVMWRVKNMAALWQCSLSPAQSNKSHHLTHWRNCRKAKTAGKTNLFSASQITWHQKPGMNCNEIGGGTYHLKSYCQSLQLELTVKLSQTIVRSKYLYSLAALAEHIKCKT